jgi:hypothetical protein
MGLHLQSRFKLFDATGKCIEIHAPENIIGRSIATKEIPAYLSVLKEI